jgi:hypothetical protein
MGTGLAGVGLILHDHGFGANAAAPEVAVLVGSAPGIRTGDMYAVMDPDLARAYREITELDTHSDGAR